MYEYTHTYIYVGLIYTELHFVMLCIPLLKVCSVISAANIKTTNLSSTEVNENFPWPDCVLVSIVDKS